MVGSAALAFEAEPLSFRRNRLLSLILGAVAFDEGLLSASATPPSLSVLPCLDDSAVEAKSLLCGWAVVAFDEGRLSSCFDGAEDPFPPWTPACDDSALAASMPSAATVPPSLSLALH